MKIQSALRDIQNAASAAKRVKELRAAGHDAKIGVIKVIPVLKTGNWGWTMESSVLSNISAELSRAVRDVFYTFDEELQKELTFTPAPGEWVDRAKLWKTALKSTLAPTQYRMAMSALLSWYVRCVTIQRSASRELSPEVLEATAEVEHRYGNTVNDKVLTLAESVHQLCDKFYKLGCEHASKGMGSAVSSIVSNIECESLRNDIEWLLRKSYTTGYEAGRVAV